MRSNKMKNKISAKAAEILIQRAHEYSVELAEIYNVPISSIVWMGSNHYIIVKDGEEIKI